jgi:hypothetical protein
MTALAKKYMAMACGVLVAALFLLAADGLADPTAMQIGIGGHFNLQPVW